MLSSTSFAQEVNRAQLEAMKADSLTMSFGLGIDDPKRIFGTTLGLCESFGHDRVFDIPTAENGMTGVGIGAAIAGSRVLMTHQRLDFFLLAMDQLVNNAAKWHYMFDGQMAVPITIRLIVGRGWGQGPTHAQNLQSWFAHIPGLKVVIASRAEVVAQQLYQAIMDNNPVLFIEHRWLHQQICEVSNVRAIDEEFQPCELLRKGNDVTILSNSYMTLESLHAAEFLSKQNVNCDVIDTAGMHDLNWKLIYKSIKKTGRLVVCDSARRTFSCASEMVATIAENCFKDLRFSPIRIGLPDIPEPTSFGLTKEFYPGADTIVNEILTSLGRAPVQFNKTKDLHDVPGDWFKGPF